MNEIITGDCLKELKKLDADSIDLICTDPPYGYSFMGKNWDKAVPSVEIWQECLRVLKPGAFCFVMSAPRSDVQMHMIMNLEKAGFRIDFTPIYWTYASGFPKAGNIGKMVDKRLGNRRKIVGTSNNPKMPSGDSIGGRLQGAERIYSDVTSGSSELEGSYAGFQPKPAVEVIIVAMKPLSEKTFVDQALKNGKGITWIDDCRIPIIDEQNLTAERYKYDINNSKNKIYNKKGDLEARVCSDPTHQTDGEVCFTCYSPGRFPANLLVSDGVLNDHSRFFDLDKWANTLPFLIVPKASKGEKNGGLENFEPKKTNDGRAKDADKHYQRGATERQNHHPTVKPLQLMSYLVTLGSRPGDVVLDPFVGSGTTCIAASKLGRKYIGIERESEYVELARARIYEAERQTMLL